MNSITVGTDHINLINVISGLCALASIQRGMSPKECLGTNATDCGHLQVAFFECKRSLVRSVSC